MKIKTSELIGPALDWAVAKLLEKEDRKITLLRPTDIGWIVEREVEYDSAPNFERFWPSRSWAQGGSIVDRRRISVRTYAREGHPWVAFVDFGGSSVSGVKAKQYGPTPLIAAMRCYVASEWGDEVDVPEELV